MVIDLKVLCHEMDELDKDGITYNNLMISKDAHVIMPYHIVRDQEDRSQEKGGIRTTGRGIGPSYADKIARRVIAIIDLYNPDILKAKLGRILKFYQEQNRRSTRSSFKHRAWHLSICNVI